MIENDRSRLDDLLWRSKESNYCEGNVNTEKFGCFSVGLISHFPLGNDFDSWIGGINWQLYIDQVLFTMFCSCFWNSRTLFGASESLSTGIDVREGEGGANVSHPLQVTTHVNRGAEARFFFRNDFFREATDSFSLELLRRVRQRVLDKNAVCFPTN